MKNYALFFLLWIGSYTAAAAEFTLESSAFQANSLIPTQYTCHGDNKAPPLAWHNAPAKTKSFALIVVEQNTSEGDSVTHWVVFNIPPTETEIKNGLIPKGAQSGNNNWGNIDYHGPCPTIGAHSYVFKLYAIDKVLNLKAGATSDDVLNAMTGHVLGGAQLMGLYQKIP